MRGSLLVETLIKMQKSLKKSLCGIVLNSVSSPGYTVLLGLLRKSIWWEMTKKYVLSEKNTWYHILSQKVQGFDRNDVIYFLKYRVMI